MTKVIKYLNDDELLKLAEKSILVEGLQGLVKVENNVIFEKNIKLRVGAIVCGGSYVAESCDIGLAGGAIIQASQLGKNSAITGGAKIFNSECGNFLRNYGSSIKDSQVGEYFVIRSSAECRNLVCGPKNKLKMFARVFDSHLGNYNSIGAHSYIGNCQLGDQNHIGDYARLEFCKFGDQNQIGHYVHFNGDANSEPTIIEDNCKIGSHVTIQKGCHIRSQTVIPDHALVFMKNGKTVMSIIDTGDLAAE